MLLTLLFRDPLNFLSLIIALLCAITIHEFAHAYVANKLGDDTAEKLGRVSLNPKNHLDPIGSLALLIFGFGWGKPVPINSSRLKNIVKDTIVIALAGPLSNLLLATLLGIIYHLVDKIASPQLLTLILITGYYNLLLMIFNLIPIPPLDGSNILKLFVPFRVMVWLQQYGIFILIAVIFISFGNFNLLSLLISNPVNSLFSTLFGRSFLF